MSRTFIVAGLGLLGGSLALALKKRIPDCRIVAWGRSATRLAEAGRAGLVDAWCTDAAELPADAEAAIVCTPVDLIAETVRTLFSVLGPAAYITDVGSTKAGIAAALAGDSSAGRRFVGSHPMAGSEKSGWNNASADLFCGCTVAIAPTGTGDGDVAEKVTALWTLLGAKTVRMTPDEHDRAVAWTSHLPHLVSFALASVVGRADAGQDAFQGMYGNGLRDMLRLSGSEPAVWTAILRENADAVRESLAVFIEELRKYDRILAAADREELSALLAGTGNMGARVCARNQ